MSIKELYIQSYIGGTGLAKKEALQIPKAFNAKNRARIRHLLGLKPNPAYKELQDLTRNVHSYHLPLEPLKQADIDRAGLNKNIKYFFTKNRHIISERDLQQSPELSQSLVNSIKDNIKFLQDHNIPMLYPDGGIQLEDPIRTFARRLAKKRSIQKGGLRPMQETSPDDFTELYKGYRGLPFKTATPARFKETPTGYLENNALWFSPRREIAETYGDDLAVFKTTPEIKAFAKRTSTPVLATDVSWEDRISGKARRDAQTNYNGKGGKAYQRYINYETVLPYQYWEYYLQHPELVTLFDTHAKMGYTPLYRKLLL